jgi:hypothetical protein
MGYLDESDEDQVVSGSADGPDHRELRQLLDERRHFVFPPSLAEASSSLDFNETGCDPIVSILGLRVL